MENNDFTAIRPMHYRRLSPEPIDVITSWKLNFCLGNCIKYISRAGFKDPQKAIEDLEKAKFYLEKEIALRTVVKGGQ